MDLASSCTRQKKPVSVVFGPAPERIMKYRTQKQSVHGGRLAQETTGVGGPDKNDLFLLTRQILEALAGIGSRCFPHMLAITSDGN